LPTGDYTFLQTDTTVVCRVSTSRVAVEDEEEEEEEGAEAAEAAEGAEGAEAPATQE